MIDADMAEETITGKPTGTSDATGESRRKPFKSLNKGFESFEGRLQGLGWLQGLRERGEGCFEGLERGLKEALRGTSRA